MKTLLSLTGGILAATTLGLSAQTTLIEVRLNALGPTNYAPLAAVFHDGSYDIFDPGGSASSELETLAEVGDPGPLLGAIPGSANGGTNGGPTFSGGFTTFQVLVDNTNTFFNFASMVLPTNDWFIGNPNAIDVSSVVGAAFGTTLTITPPSVWDAGTEQEDFLFNAPPNTPGPNNPPGGNPDDVSTIEIVGTSSVGGGNPFAQFLNQPVGFDPTSLDFTGSDFASITLTVVPEPSTGLLAGLGLLGLLRRRRR
ncbi:MAG: spondin domain-containing protein [Verrucomicrobiota bacterium]